MNGDLERLERKQSFTSVRIPSSTRAILSLFVSVHIVRSVVTNSQEVADSNLAWCHVSRNSFLCLFVRLPKPLLLMSAFVRVRQGSVSGKVTLK